MDQIREKQNHFLHLNVRDTIYWLLIVFLTLPHMKPDYVASAVPTADLIFDILRGTSFLIIALWYVIEKKPVSVVVVLVAVWRAFLVFSTFVHEGEVHRSIMDSFSIISVALLYDVAYNNRKSIFLSAQLFCFELALYINLYTIFAFPSGLYTQPPEYYTKYWFLGLYNMYTRQFVPALMFAWLYKSQTGNQWRTYTLTAVIFVTVFKVWSGGQIAVLCAMVIVYLFFKNRTKLFNYYTYWLLHIVFFVAVFVFRFQNLFRWFIDGFLGKWSSLTGRMYVWDKTFELFLKYPIIGHGTQNGLTVRIVETGLIWAGHAHNMLLELLYQGGVIGLVLWVCIVLVSGQRLLKYGHTMESKIISTAFLGWCVATLVEPFTTSFLMGMFVIAYRSNRGEPLAQGDAAALPHREKPRWGRRIRTSTR